MCASRCCCVCSAIGLARMAQCQDKQKIEYGAQNGSSKVGVAATPERTMVDGIMNV